ncbi:HNH endonuclease [Rhizobium freirei]
MHLAHRVVCEKAHGVPSFPDAQAAHRCGNNSCVNPNHVRWATQAENEEDKRAHGTWEMRMGGAKLSVEIVLDIRSDAAGGASYEALSSRYNTPASTIKKVVRRHTWKHV